MTIFSQSRRLSILLPPSLLSSLSFRSWKKPVRSLTTVLIGSMSLLQLVLQSVLLLLASLEFISSLGTTLIHAENFQTVGKFLIVLTFYFSFILNIVYLFFLNNFLFLHWFNSKFKIQFLSQPWLFDLTKCTWINNC